MSIPPQDLRLFYCGTTKTTVYWPSQKSFPHAQQLSELHLHLDSETISGKYMLLKFSTCVLSSIAPFRMFLNIHEKLQIQVLLKPYANNLLLAFQFPLENLTPFTLTIDCSLSFYIFVSYPPLTKSSHPISFHPAIHLGISSRLVLLALEHIVEYTFYLLSTELYFHPSCQLLPQLCRATCTSCILLVCVLNLYHLPSIPNACILSSTPLIQHLSFHRQKIVSLVYAISSVQLLLYTQYPQ